MKPEDRLQGQCQWCGDWLGYTRPGYLHIVGTRQLLVHRLCSPKAVAAISRAIRLGVPFLQLWPLHRRRPCGPASPGGVGLL